MVSTDGTASVRESGTAPMRLLLIQLLAAAPAPVAPVPPRATIELHWAAPEGCPTEVSVRHELERRLSGVPALGRHIGANAEIYQVAEGLALDLHLYSDSELLNQPVRHYERASCRELVDMAVDEIGSVFPSVHARADEPASSSVPPPSRPVPRNIPPVTARPPRSVSAAVRLGGIVGSQGIARGQAVLGGSTVGLGLLGRRWRLEVAALYLKTDRLPYRVGDGYDIRVGWQVAAGQLTACGAVVVRGPGELHLCGGGEIGGFFGKLAAQIDGPKISSQLWLALHAGAMVSIRLHQNVYLWASGTPVFAFPWTVDVDIKTADAIHSNPVPLGAHWFQVRGALGLEIRWGR